MDTNMVNLANAPYNSVVGMTSSLHEVNALQKALSAGYGSDVASLTGGGALRLQSIDYVLQATVQQAMHLKFFNKVMKQTAVATVDEWTTLDDVGGYLGSSFNTETGAINDVNGTFNRHVGLVKYLMSKRGVSVVQEAQSTIIDSVNVESSNAALQLLSDVEYSTFEGDAAVVPTEFDGLYATLRAQGLTSNILNANGSPLTSIQLVADAASVISGYGSYGVASDVYWSNNTQADMDVSLEPAYRVALANVPGGGIMTGAPVNGIRTSGGDLTTNNDVFIRDGFRQAPFEVYSSAIAAANNFAPASVTAAATSDTALSKFTTGWNGNYYYAVTGINSSGQSVVTKSSVQAVAVGEKVTLTITASSAGTETGYVIYRSKLGGTNTTADFRYVDRVAKAGATTTYVDRNEEIPGTSKVYVTSLNPMTSSAAWRQFLPLFTYPLASVNTLTINFAVALCGYMRWTKPKHHAVIKNVLSTAAKNAWNPMG